MDAAKKQFAKAPTIRTLQNMLGVANSVAISLKFDVQNTCRA